MAEQQRRNRPEETSREALLRAATALFAERGPAAVSTREIAAAAGVNNGLIHRHFTTKDTLLREALARLAADIAAAEDTADTDGAKLLRFLDATAERASYWKLLARCILDGKSPEELQGDFPTVRRIVGLLEHLQAAGAVDGTRDPRSLATLFIAMALGWFVFEPWLVQAVGVDDRDRGVLRRELRATAMALLGLPATE
jgi:TetR/AcrR family transcriptional regulator, repressor for neighboring sulfatase